MVAINFTLNGRTVSAEVRADEDALTMLRERFELTGAKPGCLEGQCGACTILLDGRSADSCLLFAADCDGRTVVTIEGLEDHAGLDKLQEAFVQRWATQCGFCTPGMIMQAKYLIGQYPGISEEELKLELEGNLCRCTGYRKILDAILDCVREGAGTE